MRSHCETLLACRRVLVQTRGDPSRLEEEACLMRVFGHARAVLFVSAGCIIVVAAQGGFQPQEAVRGLSALASLPVISAKVLDAQMHAPDADLIGMVLGEERREEDGSSSSSGKGRHLAVRDLDVEEFVQSLPTSFQGNSLRNLAYVDAGLKNLRSPEEGADILSIMQVGRAHTSQHSQAELEERGRQLLLSSSQHIRRLFTTDSGDAASEDELQSLLYHISRSLDSTPSPTSSPTTVTSTNGAAIVTSPTEQLMALGPQFYPNPLLEVGLADLALDLLGSSRRVPATRPVVSTNSLLRMGLDQRGSLGPQDLMKRGYKVLEDLDDETKVTLGLEDLTTLRPNSPSLQAALRAISKGVTSYNMGTANTLAKVIDAGAAVMATAAAAANNNNNNSPTSTPAPSSPASRALHDSGNEPDEYQMQQMEDLTYALIGLNTVVMERGPRGEVTADELVYKGQQAVDNFTADQLYDLAHQTINSLRPHTRRALTQATLDMQKQQQGGDSQAHGSLLSFLAKAASASSSDQQSLDQLVSNALDLYDTTTQQQQPPLQAKVEWPGQQQKQQGTGSKAASPEDLLKLGLLQLGLSHAQASTSLSLDDLVNLGAQQLQHTQDGRQPLSPPDLIKLGSAVLDRVASDMGDSATEPQDVFNTVAAAMKHAGPAGLRLAALDVGDLMRLGQVVKNGDKLRMMHANTAIEVMQEHPDSYKSHAEGHIAFRL